MVNFLKGDEKIIRQNALLIKAIMFDVDGVMTKGEISYNADGKEIKSFNVRDGLRIKLAQKYGLKIIIVTGRLSSVVTLRANELKIDELYQGALNKGNILKKIQQKLNLKKKELAYIGDDIIDIPILRNVGLAGAVADCSSDILPFCHIITQKKGGEGAAGEFIEFILSAKGYWMEIIQDYSIA